MTEQLEIVQKSRLDNASNIINRNVLWALGAGTAGSFVPVPMADAALIGAVQLKLVAQLSKNYNVPFCENAAKGVIGSLVGGLTPGWAAGAYISLIRMVPVVGNYLALATLPIFGAATTFALGKVFVQHFESGGTFLNFNPEATREYFMEQFEKGKKIVAELPAGDKTNTPLNA